MLPPSIVSIFPWKINSAILFLDFSISLLNVERETPISSAAAFNNFLLNCCCKDNAHMCILQEK